MAESHKFSTVEKLREAFPEAPVRVNKTRGIVQVYNSKENTYATVEEGNFVVKIADRFEVHDKEPSNAKPADEKDASKGRDAKDGKSSEDTPKAVKGNQTVVPEELGTQPGPESK